MNLLTRRFPTILGLLLLIAGAVVGIWYLTQNKPKVSLEIVPTKVRITNTADNKFTVSWVTKLATTGVVEFGPVGQKLTEMAYDDRDSEDNQGDYITHHITVEGLQPETQYAFRILSTKKNVRFDNNGSPYSVTTGPTIAAPPAARSFYGEVGSPDGKPTGGTIVYLGMPGAAPVSTLVTSSSNYSFALSTVRTSDLSQYISYDPSATVANITIESGTKESTVTVTTANAAPVPKVLLGENHNFVTEEQPPIAQVETGSPTPAPSSTDQPNASPVAQTPGIFNVEPLTGNESREAGGGSEVMLLNPQREGEKVATTKPEFRGTGPEATVLSITVHSTKPLSDTVLVDDDGTWSWTPPADLEPGQHTITIAYIDEAGKEQTLTRNFFVSAVLAAEGDPAFVSTPSASLKASASPVASVKASATPSPSVKASPTPKPSPSAVVNYSPDPNEEVEPSDEPREIIPSTESGVPVTGLLTPTLLTGTAGLVIMVLGALLLAL